MKQARAGKISGFFRTSKMDGETQSLHDHYDIGLFPILYLETCTRGSEWGSATGTEISTLSDMHDLQILKEKSTHQ